MRRADREVTEVSDIVSIISDCKVIRLAMLDGDIPYIVPMNFGFSAARGQITFYLHSALEGHKLELLRREPRVAFELDTDHELIEKADPCRCGFRYSSVMGRGHAEFLEGRKKEDALSALMLQQVGRNVSFTAEQAASVEVFAVHVDSISAKMRV